jgi:hypothetical protein
VVDALCGNAVLKGSDIFATGILCCTPQGKSTYSNPVHFNSLVAVYCDLEGHCLRGSSEYNGMKMFLGNGQFKVQDKHGLFRMPPREVFGLGVLMTEPIYKCPSLQNVVSSGFTIQSLPVMHCIYLMLVSFALPCIVSQTQ